MYKILLRPILFLFDPEKVHYFTFGLLRFLFAIPGVGGLFKVTHQVKNSRLEREVFGLKFPNPVGLAAGFDKDAALHERWGNLGFGFVEVGTVTPLPQAGNPKKRLFRLPKDKAILNRMGFNNSGVASMARKLKEGRSGKLIVGGNIGKNKDTANENASTDYVKCYEALYEWVDYFVVNVSSPNTPGLRALQEREPLMALLNELVALNENQIKPKPLLLKIAPDLTDTQLDEVVEIAMACRISGLVATNTTISREGLVTPAAEVQALGAGGISGGPLTRRSTEVIQRLVQTSKGKLPIIAVGGIMSPIDAAEKLAAGASLVQIYTGFIYNGPGFAKRICKHLLK
jgi:dihydroorotate dehydrogenase